MNSLKFLLLALLVSALAGCGHTGATKKPKLKTIILRDSTLKRPPSKALKEQCLKVGKLDLDTVDLTKKDIIYWYGVTSDGKRTLGMCTSEPAGYLKRAKDCFPVVEKRMGIRILGE
jgi:outer membrane lipopolysaccharide assembly protein LptE/RlpB